MKNTDRFVIFYLFKESLGSENMIIRFRDLAQEAEGRRLRRIENRNQYH